MKINSNYHNVEEGYLFSTIAKKVNEFKAAHPDKEIIRLGIGDVTLPLPQIVVKALVKASEEMGDAKTFKGYGEEQGYAFLRDKIADYYKTKGVTLSSDEIFVSDGAKSDLGNILDIFSVDNTVLMSDIVYPVYLDTNVMAGRKVKFFEGNAQNNFLPLPDESVDADIIYICSPCNPTGAVYDKAGLKAWVDYANKKGAIILFDSAYEAFIQDKTLPTSIYEIEGAKTCAIEICSLSKTAGFTGTRCGYTVVPKDLVFENTSLNKMWLRRQTTKFNGVSYVIQRGAEAVFTDEGYKQTRENIAYYLGNAKVMMDTLDELGIWYVGGKNSPYIWLKCPGNMNSWDFFDLLLSYGVVGTPGVGFGVHGDGYFRLTAFGNRENVVKAMAIFKQVVKDLKA
ncbi:lL-diaminopimelate aminotransferase [Acidaminococcus sp. CAG:917]|nr:lL-diaminopimelate aminotransferase [Acidaminococcus sp. CAG:917]